MTKYKNYHEIRLADRWSTPRIVANDIKSRKAEMHEKKRSVFNALIRQESWRI
jgi:hypothetical protein